MKKLCFFILLVLSFPFINALFFTPSIKIDTTLSSPIREVSAVADNMIIHEYSFFENGTIRVNKGIYGYLLGSLYIIYLKKTYDYVPSDVNMAKQYKKDFRNKGRTFAIVTIKRVNKSGDDAVLRTYLPGERSGYNYSKALISSELEFN